MAHGQGPRRLVLVKGRLRGYRLNERSLSSAPPTRPAGSRPLKHSYTLVFPRHTLWWLVMGLVLIYVVLAMLLTPASIHLLPREMVVGMLRSTYGFPTLLLGIPCGIYLMAWRASDFFVWWWSPRSLVVDDRGLRSGSTSLAWGQVRSIVRRHQEDQLVLRHDRGTYRLRLYLWSDPDELEALVTDSVVSELLEEVHHQVSQGEAVPFGPLTLSDAGLTYKRRLIHWDDIDSIRFQDESDTGAETRELILTVNGRRHKLDEAKVVNAPVLLAYLSARLAG
jgi:hypothetical protein